MIRYWVLYDEDAKDQDLIKDLVKICFHLVRILIEFDFVLFTCGTRREFYILLLKLLFN